MSDESSEVFVSITKMNGGFLALRSANQNCEQRIFTNMNKAVSWIKEVLVDSE